jgi:hypothetical protein
MLWVGQLSGIIMVTGMSMNNKSLLPGFMISFVILIAIAAILITFIKESAMIQAEQGK